MDVRRNLPYWLLGAAVALLFPLGCDDDDDSLDNTGSSCTTADECYPGVAPDTLQGEVVCMDRVPDGYCTHLCNADADCCAADGECLSGFEQVCAPFESADQNYCFLSCEGQADENYCATNAHEDFICRSTGGGNKNRKICVPSS